MGSIDDFLELLNKEEHSLIDMSFRRLRVERKGLYAVYVSYEHGNTSVKFMYGPPEYHVEIVVYNSGERYGFNDLLDLPAVAEWFQNRRPEFNDQNVVTKEIKFYIEMLQIALPALQGPQRNSQK